MILTNSHVFFLYYLLHFLYKKVKANKRKAIKIESKEIYFFISSFFSIIATNKSYVNRLDERNCLPERMCVWLKGSISEDTRRLLQLGDVYFLFKSLRL